MKKCLLLVLTLLMLGCLATADAETAYPTGLVYEIYEGGTNYRFPLNEIVATKDGEGVIWPARPDIAWTAVTIDEDGVITIPYIDFSVSDANEYIDSFNNYDERGRFMTNNYPQFWYSGEHREGPLRIQIKGEINGIPAEYNYESINNIFSAPLILASPLHAKAVCMVPLMLLSAWKTYAIRIN